MNKIVMLWATPRSTSTAFEWMMRMRDDMICFHEPYGESWYKGDEALWPRLTADSPRVPGLTPQVVTNRIMKAAAESPVFIKDMPMHTDHLWTDEFLLPFTNTFIIRDPGKVLTSIYAKEPEWTTAECGFAQQHKLFLKLMDETGTPPITIDSDDMLEDPHSMIDAYCRAVEIPFIPEALSWEPGARKEVSWYDGGSWHDSLSNSDGLKPQPRRDQVDISEAPDKVKEWYDMFMPLYQEMHAHRLVVKKPVSA